MDFREVSLVLQFLATTNLETVLQRMGRSGRKGTSLAEGVFMVQDSLFDDSKQGRKRAEKIKNEEEPVPLPAKLTKKAAASAAKKAKAIEKASNKARQSAKTYSEGVRQFINATGCRVEVLDREYDNPPRPEGELCYCDICRKWRGEEGFLEKMRRL